ncbi:translation initiation factor IF-2 N-terminal domain-containing protein [Nocardia terpenica]|uniref:translation initiation factor IF-2 N-terminal domain-containing protein n=1 Tax=Nocardia terpenica TaxID=455432 RepID=UPI003A5B96D7
MADQEPLETSKNNGERASHEAVGAGEAAQLPERIRVHALAKLLGTTSKRILAHLTELGAEARSPQSSLDRTVAESVRDAFVPAEPEQPTDPTPEPAAEAAVPEPSAENPEPAAEEPAPVETVAPAEVPAPTEPEPQRQSLFASPFQPPQVQVDEPVAFEAAATVAAPLFLPPDAAAAEEMRRKRRAERQAKVEARTQDRPEDKPAEPADADRTKTERGKDDRSKDERAKSDRAKDDRAEDEDTTDDSAEWDDEQSHDDGEDGGRSRRRRRGRRGRGRGRGEQHQDGDEATDADDAEDTDEDADAETTDESTDESAAVPEGSSRRRRRRRRRKGGDEPESEPSDDDPPNTVVHEREPRSKRRAAVDEVQGISGSTRLEAKRQRRRDGREAGRRRPPILTESEFLARRESVDRVMVVREKAFPDHPSATTQVAVLEDNILVEHFVTSTGQASMVGNVYLGKVQNVLPSMEAAFVDIGRGRNGVLYAGEVNWEAAGLGGRERKIEQALRPGDTVLVQVSKDPVGHKGARLTTQISLAGRFLVYVPGGSSTGISRKLPDTERKRLKEILRDIVPQDAGVIIRTASEGVSETELARDVERLQSTWKTIEGQSRNGSSAPKTLYEEPDLLVKVIRDLFNEDFSKLVIEGDRAWTTVENYIRTVAPDLLARVERYDSGAGVDVFGSYRIDEQLAKALDRKVWLPSGGTLVIDRTEAMTVIDVNTGKFTGAGGSNLEETVTRNNLEAAEEIVRQMRLRDIGGMIVVDFIDMVLESNRDLVLRRLTESLGRDRTRHQVSEVTSLGLVQMTRKKLGTGLVEAFSTTCEHCHGRGILVHNYPVETAQAEEGVGRREGRRRRKDKAASPAEPAAANGAAPVESHEEDAAVKRAHPVALAMAAHHTDEDIDVVEAVADAVEAQVADQLESESAPVPPTREERPTRRRERGSRRAVRAAGSETAAPTSKTEAAHGTAEVSASSGAAVPDTAATPTDTAVASTGKAVVSADTAAALTDTAVASTDTPAASAGKAVASTDTVAASADTAGALTGKAVASADTVAASADTAGASAGSGVASADSAAAVSDTAVASASSSAAGAETIGVPSDTAGAVTDSTSGSSERTEAPAKAEAPAPQGDEAAEAAPRTRRRVARTAAAPAADSKGAVFVLSSSDRDRTPAVDFTADAAPVAVPRTRQRRRAAGRAAGAPEQND